MKIILNKFLIVVLFLFSAVVNAQDLPVPCTGPNCPPVAPDLPIDDNLIILLLIGILFGIYSIHKYKIKTKASM